MKIGSFISWLGGGFNRAAATAVVTGAFVVITGVMPWEAVKMLIDAIPEWMTNGWFRFFLVIIGFTIIGVSLHGIRLSRQQKAFDDFAEDLSCVTSNMLYRTPTPSTQTEVDDCAKDYSDWCEKVSGKLGDRSFFTRADQLHFDRLGFIDTVLMSGQPNYDKWLGQLRLKFDRLRDVINWTQMRRR